MSAAAPLAALYDFTLHLSKNGPFLMICLFLSPTAFLDLLCPIMFSFVLFIKYHQRSLRRTKKMTICWRKTITTDVFVSIAVPVATILGEGEIYLDAGSTINITCLVKHTPVPPSHVTWEHQGKVSTTHQTSQRTLKNWCSHLSPLGKHRHNNNI